MTSRRARFLSAVGINLAAAIVAVLAFDVWRRNQPTSDAGTHLEGSINESSIEPADDLGYILRPGRRLTARLMAGQEILYDVVYTIGPDGFRVTPPLSGSPGSCVVLFGDSNTFGIGVNDDETHTAHLVRLGEGRIAAYNFGVAGYGPHQMLAGLQSGRFERILSCTPTHTVYFFIPHQISRVAGRVKWDTHGPRYRLDAAGRAVADGNFDSPGFTAPTSDLDEGVLGWRRLFGVRVTGTPEETDLTAAVLVESAREMRRIAPATTFHVLFWDIYNDARLDAIERSLKAAGITVHPLDAIIPGYRVRAADYILRDRHPNPRAHRRIADYIALAILGPG